MRWRLREKKMDINAKVAYEMAVYEKDLVLIFNDELLAIILHGSVVLNDFREGKGDLDFVVIIKDAITDEQTIGIENLHKNYRIKKHGQLLYQLEGTYYPINVVKNPSNCKASGFYIGTNINNWKIINKSVNSMMDYKIIKDYGWFLKGESIRNYIYNPTRDELIEEIKNNYNNIKKNIEVYDSFSYAVAMSHWLIRSICYLKTNEIKSKTEASNWYIKEYPESKWKNIVNEYKIIRFPYEEYTEEKQRYIPGTIKSFFIEHEKELRRYFT